MKIYRIRLNVAKGYAALESEGFEFELRKKIYLGQKVDTISNEKFVLKSKNEKYPDIMGSSSIPFVSERFKNLIEVHSNLKNVNFLPVQIGKNNYWLLNVIGFLDCFDGKESIFSTFSNGEPDEIQKLVLQSDKIPTLAIFKIKESPINIFITNALKEVIDKDKISGIQFFDSDDLTTG